MNTDVQTVSDVFCEVLEAFAFMFADPLPADAAEVGGDEALRVTMTFAGPSGGTMTLVAPEPLCRSLAANALGIDDEDAIPDEAKADSLKELLNITCGNVLTKTFGTSPVFNLSIPEVAEADPEVWRRLMGDPNAAAFCVDGIHVVALCFSRDEPVAAR